MTRSADAIRDEWLVLRAQDGESEAFEELVGRWHARLGRHARRLCSAPELSADAVQEAWLAIVRGLRRLEDPARFRAWAFRIVGNKVADLARRRRRQREAEDSAAERARNPEAATTGNEHPETLREALRRLPTDRRVILELRYLEELTVIEIASVLDLPEGTVKSRLHFARNQLQRALEMTK